MLAITLYFKAKRVLLSLFLVCSTVLTNYAQGSRVITDAKHLAIVNENGAVRLSSEQLHNNMLASIQENSEAITLNFSAVLLVQQMIYRSLSEVEGVLRSGRSALQIGKLVEEIYTECTGILEEAKSEPWLLLVAEEVSRQLKGRGVRLATDVSDFILKEGENVLMDFEKRDYLLRKVTLELKVMRALLFSMGRAMHWAKVNGFIKTANPYRNFINQDKRKAEEILLYFSMLKE